jgi:N-acyl-D-amino-acid deacylase
MTPLRIVQAWLVAALCVQTAQGAEAGAAFLITNARIVDGTGQPARQGAVRIVAGRIDAVGELAPRRGETVIDAAGLTLTPGFIDTHSHHDEAIFDLPDALGAVSQGVTTIIAGQDGHSRFPLHEFFAQYEQTPAAINVASYVGHNTLRSRVLGQDYERIAAPAEVETMAKLVRSEMEAGALGLSTGLEYDPGIYSDRDEIIALARVAAPMGGRYISHIRSEDRAFWDAIDEILAIGRETRMPVQISHVKLAMRKLWGQSAALIQLLNRARAEGVDVSADLYPYPYWQSTLTVMFPERNFEDRAQARLVLEEIASPEGLLLGQFAAQPEYAGKTVAQIARLRRSDPATTLLDLIKMSLAYQERARLESKGALPETGETVIGTSMDEKDIAALLEWPHTNLCTDGELNGKHPRGFGSYPRVLGRYVREQGLLSLEAAVYKSTLLAAKHVGLFDRGAIAPGMAADLVLLNPQTVLDRASTSEPHAPAIGIDKVWVAGELVWDGARTTGARPGKALRRSVNFAGR